MKTSLKSFAVILAAGFPCVAFAEILGAPIPAVVNVENAVALFATALLALMVLGDYSRRATFSVTAANAAVFKDEKHRLAA